MGKEDDVLWACPVLLIYIGVLLAREKGGACVAPGFAPVSLSPFPPPL
jgi:hypothetical protein